MSELGKMNMTEESYPSILSGIKNGENKVRETLISEVGEDILQEYFLPFNLTIDKSIPPDQSALIVLPGQYEEWRLTEQKDLWKQFAGRIIIPGTRGDPFYDKKKVCDLMNAPQDAVILRRFASNTPDQMEWSVETAKELSLRQIIISTAAYHIPRCVYTFVKACIKSDYNHDFNLGVLPIFNPNSENPISTDRARSEIERMKEYQEKGDVATSAEYMSFIENLKQAMANRQK